MITIKDSLGANKKITRTNDIPRNTTFRGTIISAVTGSSYTGLWLQLGAGYLGTNVDPVTVGLDRKESHALISKCSEVRGYEPVEIELTVKRSV